MQQQQKGFSLIELLVVVAIIGVLAAAGVVGYQNYTDSAKKNVAKNNSGQVIRYLRTQSGIKGTGIEEGCSATVLGGCTAASAASFSLDYFEDQGFTNPYDADTSAVSDAAASYFTTALCSGSDSGKGLIGVTVSGSTLSIKHCDLDAEDAADTVDIVWGQ